MITYKTKIGVVIFQSISEYKKLKVLVLIKGSKISRLQWDGIEGSPGRSEPEHPLG